MKNPPKVLTLQEAQKLIPAVLIQLQAIQNQKHRVLALEVEIDSLELIADEKSKTSGVISKKILEHKQLVEVFYDLIEKLHERGCLLKDVDSGLVDFYAMCEGRLVFLCWKIGESEIGHWHEIEGGYATRQPITAKFKKS